MGLPLRDGVQLVTVLLRGERTGTRLGLLLTLKDNNNDGRLTREELRVGLEELAQYMEPAAFVQVLRALAADFAEGAGPTPVKKGEQWGDEAQRSVVAQVVRLLVDNQQSIAVDDVRGDGCSCCFSWGQVIDALLSRPAQGGRFVELLMQADKDRDGRLTSEELQSTLLLLASYLGAEFFDNLLTRLTVR